jgi:hypothetical protein
VRREKLRGGERSRGKESEVEMRRDKLVEGE